MGSSLPGHGATVRTKPKRTKRKRTKGKLQVSTKKYRKNLYDA